ncbi:MAG: RNA polymerase sigma-70 factor, ECF subfamily [Candidatus Moranbacteria bacterium GW2011_GWC2_45_10]|nr:MAG: RNA polymerase sigma-70 factor, ECF subfamily [Candidatus Moranbacteria bacterium GW2011_GWC2_45_10]
MKKNIISENEEISARSDEELVKLTLQNPDYYRVLVERYEEKLLRYIMRISASTREDGEDILQDVFVSAYKNLNGFDPDLKFSSWIYRITHNKVISHYRKTTARPKTVTYEGDNDLLNILEGESDLVADLEKKYTSGEVMDILSEMDERYREVLVLKFIEDKNYREISDILEKPMGTVATLISRAKKQFREKLEERSQTIIDK